MPDSIEVPITALYESQYDEPTEARLELGEKIAIRSDELNIKIGLSDVFDVRVSSPPKAVANLFEGEILTIGFDGWEGRDVLFIDAGESTLDSIAGLLYRRLLHGNEVVVSHPTKIGGRVTNKSFEIGKLLVTPGMVGCSGINTPFSIDLETIVDFSRSVETLLDDRRPAIDIKYIKEGVAVSLKLSLTPTRKHHLLGRFLRRDYEDVKGQIGRIDLPKPALQTLVKLYTLHGSANPQSLHKDTSISTPAVLRGLVKADLVEIRDTQIALTTRGWILVTKQVGNTKLKPDTGEQSSLSG